MTMQPPGLGWGPQFDPGPGWQQQPPRRRRTGLVVAVLSVGALVVVGLAIVLALATREDGPRVVAKPRPTAPVATASSEPPLPTPPPTTGPTVPPSTTVPTPTVTTTSVPPKPRPTRTTPPPPSSLQILARDRFYATGVHASLGCREPGVRPTSAQNVIAYNLAVKKCLDRGWPRQLRAGGDPASTPGIVNFNGVVNSPCASGARRRAYYCPGNQTIYMYVGESLDLYRQWGSTAGASGRVAARMRMLHVVAHEYGHHVQQAAGILPAYYRVRYNLPSTAARLELNRRMELQASCLAAVFVGANRRTLPISGATRRQWDWLTATSGDLPGGVRDHGSMANHKYWSARGFGSRNPSQCNNFTAAARYGA